MNTFFSKKKTIWIPSWIFSEKVISLVGWRLHEILDSQSNLFELWIILFELIRGYCSESTLIHKQPKLTKLSAIPIALPISQAPATQSYLPVAKKETNISIFYIEKNCGSFAQLNKIFGKRMYRFVLFLVSVTYRCRCGKALSNTSL